MSNASAARIHAVEALKRVTDVWDLLWSEYRDRRSEAELHWRETVTPAQAAVGAALTGPVSFPADASEARAMAEQRALQFGEVMAACEASEHRHELLLDDICRLQESLLLARAPDAAALEWKREQLLAGAGRVSADTRRIVAEDERRLATSLADRR